LVANKNLRGGLKSFNNGGTPWPSVSSADLCDYSKFKLAHSEEAISSQPNLILEEKEMTNRIIVATFNNTNSAYDAASAIKNLKESGVTQFKLKAGVMVKKDDRGNVSLVEDRERPLLGTAVGTTAGALIGLIAGAPGAALGAALGATAGLGGDAVMAALDSDFIDGVTTDMRPGMTAIVVEADEGSTRAVDDIVALGGGHVYRQAA
jgi:uncharacterized membrane protein